MRSLDEGFDIFESEIRIDLGTLSFLGIVNDGIDTIILYCVIEIAKNFAREFGQSFLVLVTLFFSFERLEGSSRATW